MAYVYKHIRKDINEIFYIGIGNDKNYNRAYQKKCRNVIGNILLIKLNILLILLKII